MTRGGGGERVAMSLVFASKVLFLLICVVVDLCDERRINLEIYEVHKRPKR